MINQLLNIVLIQTCLEWEDVQVNLIRFQGLFAKLPLDIDLVVLPEMFSTGFSVNLPSLAETMEGPTIKWMKEQAGVLRAVIAGSLIIKENGAIFNRFVFVRPEQSVEYYDKRHLFSMGDEKQNFIAGCERKIITVKSFRILPQICYDLRFPVFSRNRLDYDLMINCANWPATRRDTWLTLLKARAIENQAYVAGVNRVGEDANGIKYSGNSCIFDFRGTEVCLSSVSDREEILFARLNKDVSDHYRSSFPVLSDADDFVIKCKGNI